jgi:CheY-like chemotaxis protein
LARDVYEAEDGAGGLDAFTHYAPDIVMTDWAMPIFDGLELTQMIRQPGANANPFVPNIMVTGHTERGGSPRPAMPASPNFWRSRSLPRRSTSGSSTW